MSSATVRVLRERGANVAVLDLNAADEQEHSVITDVTDDASVRAAIDGGRCRQHRLRRGHGRPA
jgi:NAD(P)-dependent dehydrogenase (short-subunit alcohol dehydrogenase family)